MVVCNCGRTLGRGKIAGRYVCNECIEQRKIDTLLRKLRSDGVEDEPKIAKDPKPVAGTQRP